MLAAIVEKSTNKIPTGVFICKITVAQYLEAPVEDKLLSIIDVKRDI